MSEPTGLARYDRDRLSLMKLHPGWRIWFVPNALDGSVTWCAQPEPTLHAHSPEDLSTDIRLTEQDLAKRLAVAEREQREA